MPVFELRESGTKSEAEVEEDGLTGSPGAEPCPHGMHMLGRRAPPGWLVTVGHELHDTFQKGPSRVSLGRGLTLHIL